MMTEIEKKQEQNRIRREKKLMAKAIRKMAAKLNTKINEAKKIGVFTDIVAGNEVKKIRVKIIIEGFKN